MCIHINLYNFDCGLATVNAKRSQGGTAGKKVVLKLVLLKCIYINGHAHIHMDICINIRVICYIHDLFFGSVSYFFSKTLNDSNDHPAIIRLR